MLADSPVKPRLEAASSAAVDCWVSAISPLKSLPLSLYKYININIYIYIVYVLLFILCICSMYLETLSGSLGTFQQSFGEARS